jgi:hypothetical protein
VAVAHYAGSRFGPAATTDSAGRDDGQGLPRHRVLTGRPGDVKVAVDLTK